MGFVWFMYAFCMECVEYISQNGEFAKGSRNMDKKVIAARLFSERKRLGFKSALSFSDSLSLPNNTYSGWEAGRSVPKADDLADMAAAGLDVQYLVSGQRSLVSCVPDDVVRIPVMQDEPSAGNGAAADGLSQQESTIYMSSKSVRSDGGAITGACGRLDIEPSGQLRGT